MLENLNCYVKKLGILLITVALIAGMEGCIFPTSSQDLEIRDWYDLDAVRNNLSGHHILMNDLDSTTDGYEELASETANEGKGWQPIGSADDPLTGTFDGQGYEIHDLFINRPDEDFVGLFGVVHEGGHIEDIGVINANVIGNTYVGGLAGGNDGGTISNSYSTGSVTGNSGVGGLAGGNGGTVSNSYSTGSVTGNTYVGGLVGFNEEGTVSNSYSTGSVTGDYGAGGLAGGNVGTVSNSYSTGSVTGDYGAGGLLGFNGEGGTVSNSYSTGNVTGNTYVGGLVGGNADTVSNSFWDTETSGQSTSAGGTGKTTVEMKYIATFSAWDIITVTSGQTNPTHTWNIVDEQQTYPFLSWQ